MASPTGYSSDRAKYLGGEGTNAASAQPEAWNSGTDYAAGDEVLYNGIVWTASANPAIASEPTHASTDWAPAQYKGTQVGKMIDPTAPGGTNVPTTLGPHEGQPASSQLANEADRTTPLA